MAWNDFSGGQRNTGRNTWSHRQPAAQQQAIPTDPRQDPRAMRRAVAGQRKADERAVKAREAAWGKLSPQAKAFFSAAWDSRQPKEQVLSAYGPQFKISDYLVDPTTGDLAVQHASGWKTYRAADVSYATGKPAPRWAAEAAVAKQLADARSQQLKDQQMQAAIDELRANIGKAQKPSSDELARRAALVKSVLGRRGYNVAALDEATPVTDEDGNLVRYIQSPATLAANRALEAAIEGTPQGAMPEDQWADAIAVRAGFTKPQAIDPKVTAEKVRKYVEGRQNRGKVQPAGVQVAGAAPPNVMGTVTARSRELAAERATKPAASAKVRPVTAIEPQWVRDAQGQEKRAEARLKEAQAIPQPLPPVPTAIEETDAAPSSLAPYWAGRVLTAADRARIAARQRLPMALNQ